MSSMDHHDLLSGFVRIHILHHAAEGPVYGQWIIEELARHGYRLSPGTLYPMLRAMEEKGYLVAHEDREGPGGRRRRLYVATKQGREGLAIARERLRELAGEVGTGARGRKRSARGAGSAVVLPSESRRSRARGS
jgi:PadR family transcriptional regulator, regulatory protein PadR